MSLTEENLSCAADMEVGSPPSKKSCFSSFLHEVKQLRWRVTLLNCMLAFGGYYINDFPGSIGTGEDGTIEERFLHAGKTYTQSQNLALYSFYAGPSVLTVLSGLLIDKYLGLRKATILFNLLTLIGGGLFWFGILVANYPLLVIARLFTGFGAESLTVSQAAFTIRWFRGKPGMALSMSISIAFLRIPTALNFLISPEIGHSAGAATAALVGFILCGISLVFGIIISIVDHRAQDRGEIEELAGEHATPMSCKQLKEFPRMMWVVAWITLAIYCAMFPFVGIAENFFEVKYNYTHEKSGQPVSVYQALSAGGLLLAGIGVDVFGRHAFWLMTACILLIVFHVMFLVTSISPFVMMVVIAAAYCILVSSLWTITPYLVSEEQTGFAFGVMTCLLNLGLAVYPLLIGEILDSYTPESSTSGSSAAAVSGSSDSSEETIVLPSLEGYQYGITLMLLAAVVSTALTAVLIVMDKNRTGVLCASPSDRKKIEESLSDASEPFFDAERDAAGSGQETDQSSPDGLYAAGDELSAQEMREVRLPLEPSS